MKYEFDQVQKIPIGTVCSSISDTYKANAHQVVLVNTSDVLEGKVLNHQPVANKNLKGQFKKTFCTEDILYSEIRPQNKRFAFVDFNPCNYIASTKLMVLRANHQIILPRYLYYFLTSGRIIEELQMLAETRSGTFPQITFSELSNIIIPVPPLDTQQNIVDIIKCIDDKIELNQKINENLERQAQAICQQWLLENNDQYIFRPLAEVAEINPDTYSPKESWECVNYLDTSSITDGTISEIQNINPETEKLPSRARRKVLKGDIVYSTVRPNQRHFGIISSPLPNMLVSTGFAVIRSRQPQICNELIYIFITDDNFIEKMQQLAEQSTSTFPSIKPSDLGTCLVPCPIGSDGDELSKQLKAIYSFISINNKQNKKLAALRDTLLPKLMSGEIDLQEV